MAYSLISVADLAELKTRRGNSTNTTMATIMGLNYPLVEAFSVYVWDNTSLATPDDNEIVQPTIGGITTGRWYKCDLDSVPQVNSDWNSTSGVSWILNKPTIPTNTNQLTNGSGFITGITNSMITSALGFTPYNSTNPSGFLTTFTETDPTVPAYSKSLTAFSVIKTSTDALYEPFFSKNSGFNKNFGTNSDTIVEGNDSRVLNGQTAFTWGNHGTYGYLTSASASSLYQPIGSYLTPSSSNILTNKSGNISQWTNDSGYLSTFTESDPTVPSYAKSLTSFLIIKSSTDALYEPIITKNTAFNKNFGTASGTITEGNDTRVINGQTAFGWGNHASAGYLTSSTAATTYQPIGSYLTSQTNSDWNASTGVAQILNKPTLSTVATSGNYNDLTSKPVIPAAQVQTDWNASTGLGILLNKPILSTVATSGSYTDLSNKPTIPSAQVNTDWNAVSGITQILNKPTLSTVATTGNYSDLIGKPSLFSGVFADLTSKPTTISGYGITDFNSLGDARWSLNTHTHTFASLTSKPTTLSGYGITDSIVLTTNTYSNPAWITGLAWSKISSTPTTLSGYGITDAYSSSNPSNYINQTQAIAALSSGTGISYNNTTGVITNSAPDQTVTLTAGNRISITGTYPNFTISFIEPTPTIVTRSLNTNFTISSTKQASVCYIITCSVTNPLLVGTSSATAYLEYSTNGGSSWLLPAQSGNSSGVGVTVTLQLSNGQTGILVGVIPANALVRIRTTTSGTATTTYIGGQETY